MDPASRLPPPSVLDPSLTTAQRAERLAAAAAAFTPWLGVLTAARLLAWVRAELGHEEILDDFRPRPGGGEEPAAAHLTRAVPPAAILHVISGNTPHAGLQSLVRGLLLGSPENLCKLPAGGLPEWHRFHAALDPGLAAGVAWSESWRDDWCERAEAVVVYGSDAAVAAVRARLRPDQRFAAHGHRLSLGVVWDDPGGDSLPAAAADASRFDQRGCLSPHLFYVRAPSPEAVRTYAARLAGEMDRFNQREPRRRLEPADAARVASFRAQWRFEAANAPEGRRALWHSSGDTAWTVAYDGLDPGYPVPVGDRVIFVKPLPADLAGLRAALRPVRPHLGAVGLWPAAAPLTRALLALDLGATRFCPLGAMQDPPAAWHQDGAATLADLVRWIDFEPGPPVANNLLTPY